MAGERRVLTLGGKGSTLSSDSVFEFSTASPPQLLQIDPSALARLSSSPSNHKPNSASAPSKLQLSVPDFLTPEEARASILLLLYKHLLSGSPSSSAVSQLSDILSNDTKTLTLDLDFDKHANIDMLRGCWPNITVNGICALLDYTASSLTIVADAVAALSCEALKADTSTALNLFTDSGDGSSDKDMASVASDLKVLLNGSKFRGTLQCDQVDNIPIIHGRLRSLSKSVHQSTRIALNSTLLANGSVSEDLSTLFSSLAFAIKSLGESSWLRANTLVKDNIFPDLAKSFNAGCPGLDILEASVMSSVTKKMKKNYIESLHEIYALFEAVRKILSWEATVSFISLEGSELMENGERSIKGQEGVDGGNVKPDKKKDKKKKVMGKGTSVLMQFIKDTLQIKVFDTSSLVEKVAQGFLSFLDLKDPNFKSLLDKVKEVVDSNESRRLPKLAKGTRDFAKEQMAVREKAFTIIGNVFKRHGAMALDTPVFELRETLTGKYGEDSKLIYDLADQGGEICSLRYDLTVPFARYVAMNGLTSFRRYQMAKVYRRDNPSKGRYREFYQCDFDIAGDDTIAADFEVVRILVELLDELNIGDYEVKLNHRKLLDGMLEICGVPSHKVRTICSSIDKLDKQSFDQIRKEMIEEKGLDVDTVEKIGKYVCLKGHPLTLLSELKKEESVFLKNEASNQALKDLEKLFECLDKRCVDKVVLDLSLARGLDYYTGVIYEAVFKGATQVGSIAAGGRYDNLIGMFGTKRVAAIGVSLGIERVFTIMEEQQKVENQVIRASETQVLVSVLGDDVGLASKLVQMCWDAKVNAEFMANKRLNKHFDRAKEFGIPWMVIVGEREIKEGIVKIKNKEVNIEQEVAMTDFVDELIKLMNTR
ncbi:histidine--tRNA ligase, cytoplasmic [Lactuca sativa]|uniref:Histidine--tRNA ligase, cytoplasmic n=1 Tax=Lactuca sativa TaxID=4236 RepID=A0A9R1WCU5_LACSA|nr:histidine--tRNA ligase, cytoplasmic [Lactuca sativa]KAJ0220256.1 hypothetical protein LSAT_V11C200089780 [Lactuca sativa]